MTDVFPTRRLANGMIDYAYYRQEASCLRQKAKRDFWRRLIGRRPVEPAQTPAEQKIEPHFESVTA